MIQALYSSTFISGQASNKVRCVPGWMWKPSTPLFDYDLWYVFEGFGQIVLADTTYMLKPGTCMLVRPDSLPVATQDPDHRLMVLFIHFSIHAPDLNQVVIPPECSYINDIFMFEGMLHRLFEVDGGSRRWKADEFDYLMKLIFIYLYNLEYERQHNHPTLTAKQTGKIRDVIDYIQRESYSVGYGDIYRYAGLSPRYLNALFKQFTGSSLKEYLTRSRLRKAQHLLTESSLSITEIAELLGYADIYAFSKMFKQHTGVSPSHYHNTSQKTELNG
ncbi:helix-turn-helix transcriptional regulator [Paenibacillus eucommiae]|uniref:AraC-like DNA-binding protein n=1 Tax=Paenibacillus eucommiae TaxID=1355755 RepID=A0ABS4J9U1_9BACL|nr:helix-turn-helix transcriptional regulator [Paenibacillus eucommiae]MBP1996622.1 AraC-like DNA-binding protein [Paenibacillus eucommiae]